jgi:hypothetical protein
MNTRITAASTGALGFLGTQLLLVAPSNSGVRWFLNAGADIGKTLGALAVVAIAAQLLERSFLATRPVWVAFGAGAALIGYLMVIGPGNLYPLVVPMGLLMVVPTVVIAGYVGLFARGAIRRD